MTLEEAVSLLYASAVRAVHPDAQSAPPTPIDQLKDARDMLRQLVADARQYKRCALCKGKGTLRSKIAVRKCSACKGTGETT